MKSENLLPSRRERRRLQTQERLFEAALTLLCEKEFDAVTIEMITEAADVGKGTFFNYFKNKEAVIVAYFERIRGQLIESLKMPDDAALESEERNPNLPGPVWKQILLTAHKLAEVEGRSHRLTRALLSLSLTHDAVREANQRLGADVGASADALMRFGQAAGEFRADVEPAALGKFIGGVYQSALYDWALKESDEPLEIALMQNFALAWEAIRNRVETK